MGNSTVIEFNHDTMHEIFDNEFKTAQFIQQLTNVMQYGYPNPPDHKCGFMIGCKLVFFSHRDDKPYQLFSEFKAKLNAWRAQCRVKRR